MASADLLLRQVAAATLKGSTGFIRTVPVDTAKATSAAAKQFFILNTPSFIDWQIYLKAVSELPENTVSFEADFPPSIYKGLRDEYLYQVRSKLPPSSTKLLFRMKLIYQKIRETFSTIRNQCAGFSAEASNRIMNMGRPLM
jgi:hypothetical protein